MQVASALNSLGRVSPKKQDAAYFDLEQDEDFYKDAPAPPSFPLSAPTTTAKESTSSAEPQPGQPSEPAAPAAAASAAEAATPCVPAPESAVPAKRPHLHTSAFELELEDEDELNALAARSTLPSKRARLEEDEGASSFNAAGGPANSRAGAEPLTSAATATAASTSVLGERHHFTAHHLDLGIHRNAFAPVQAKTFDGTPLTLFRRRVQPQQTAESSASAAFAKLGSTLLGTPMWKLKEELVELRRVQQELLDEQMAQAVALSEANLSQLDATANRGQPQQSELWVDRYKPKRYADLLGDDRVHREAMTWLKEWDACVFKTAAAQTAKKKAMAEKRKRARREAQSGGHSYGQQAEVEDPYGRPFEKIMLLAGPPGLGKTTLAHVMAKQAGYQVHEINASDDRSAKVVSERIKNASESRAISAGGGSISENKPTCIVIDEIDGAVGGGDTGFMRTLIKFIQDGSKVHKGKGPKNTKTEQKPLLRPIICICNDLYAPVLRPLRPLARLVKFSPVTPNALVGRLRKICDTESLLADTKSLTALATAAEGDLRTCLNTLQFLKTRKAAVTEDSVKGSAVGAKDTGTSPAMVWQSLFKRSYDRKGKSQTDSSQYVERLVKQISTCGEYEKIVQGCFEYYPAAKWPVDGWRSINSALNWLHFYDLVDNTMRSDRNFDVMPYLPYTQVAWHPLLAAVANRPIDFPKTDYEAYLKRTAHREVSDAFIKNLSPLAKGSFNADTLVTELVPYLTRIISPDVKMTGSSVTKPEERVVFEKLVTLMKHFGLAFVEDKNEEGQWSFKLEPSIDVFVHYDGKRATDIPPSKYSLRQLVASTMNAEGATGEEVKSTVDTLMSAYKQAAEGGKTKAAEATAVDFFGRTKVVPVTASQTTARQPQNLAPKITYRFREGFSNAVRTPIKMHELFQTRGRA